jgi:hypothetical protein
MGCLALLASLLLASAPFHAAAGLHDFPDGVPGPNDPPADFWGWLRQWQTVDFIGAEGQGTSAPPGRDTAARDGWGDELWPTPRHDPASRSGVPAWLADDLGFQEELLENVPLQHRQTVKDFWGSLTTQVTVEEQTNQWQSPLPASPWKTEDNLQLNVLGPLFAFGQFGAAPDTTATRNLQISSRTGLGWKLPVAPGAEVQLRGGPVMTFHGTTGGEEAQWLVEVQARYTLPLQLGLEYQGAAMPALNPAARDRVTNDVRLAVPLGDAGQFKVGARHQWDNAPTARPWGEGMQLYLGLELKRAGPQ